MQPGQDPTTGGVEPPSSKFFLHAGDAFGDYEILEELGRGGMGAVYKARNRTLGRIIALKVLLPFRRDSAESVERFLREARSLAQLDHHNIVAVHHVGVSDGLQFIEMQYVDGRPLTQLLDRGPLELLEAIRIVEQVAHALSHAHRRGILHRDIKPGNILLTPDGVVKVVDFGLARTFSLALPPGTDVTETAAAPTVCGTPQYMSPEQWSGQEPDARTDQYGLGVTFYQMVTGRPPFSGEPIVQMRQHLLEAPPPPHHLNAQVPEALGRIISRLMEKDPANRYTSCEDLITDLRLLRRPPEEAPAPPAGVAPAVAPPEPPATALRRIDHRIRSLAVGTAVAAAALLAHGLGWLEPLELRSLDLRFAWSRGEGGASPVVIVAVDRESKDKLAPDRPLSRERHYGEVIARLHEAGARAIGVDLLITERASPEEDGALAAVTGMTPAVVHAFNLAVESTRPGPETQVPEGWSLDVPADGLPEAHRVDLPVPELTASSPRAGHVALSVDPDGVIRRVPHLLVYRGRVYPSLSLATVMTALGVGRDGVRFTGDAIELHPAEGPTLRIPTDGRGQMLVNFRLRERGIAEHGLWRVLDEEASTAGPAFNHGVVFVGSRLDGDYDVGALPARPAAPLVWAHALAADTMLSGSFVVPVAWAVGAVLIVGVALAAALAGGLLRPTMAAVLVAAAVALYWGGALLAFGGQTRRVLPLVAPTLAAALGYAAATLARHWGEEHEKRALAGALSRYLSPSVARRILSDPEALRLGGQRKELTVLCAEISRFAELSEALEPEEIDELLGSFFASVTDVVFKHEGTLDQFTGQGIRAFFGDPQAQEDHALRGVRCALEMRGRAAEVIRAWAHLGRPALQVGIGVSTGYVTVGNVGSLRRMEYTVLGRSADLAAQLSRLEPGRVLVSPRTRALTEGAVSYEARSGPEGVPKFHEALAPR